MVNKRKFMDEFESNTWPYIKEMGPNQFLLFMKAIDNLRRLTGVSNIEAMNTIISVMNKGGDKK
jgi:hypothetical protein